MVRKPKKFTDTHIKALPFAETGQYVVREDITPGFMVVVGKKSKTFSVQVPVKVRGKWTSRRKQLGRVDKVSIQYARRQARHWLTVIPDEEDEKAANAPDESLVTLGQAWTRYETALVKKDRSPRTIEGYRSNLNLYMSDWLDRPLIELADRPLEVETRHDKITKFNGDYAANGAMRTLSAIYNHAAKKRRNLKGLNPVEAVDMNREERRQTALTYDELPKWFEQLWNLDNGVRREFHLLLLLTGSRPTALKEAKWEHINLEDKLWHFPKPKGGSTRAFDIPLSKPLIYSLIRIRKTPQGCVSTEPDDYVFPAESVSGHMEEIKEDRETLSKYGNDLRQSFRTFGEACSVGDIQLKMLMNHKMKGVAAGYTNHKPLWPLLLENQKKIAQHIFEKAGNVDPKTGVFKKT